MSSPHITDALPTSPPVAAAAAVEPRAHRHSPSCFWQIEDARWSCDVPVAHPQGRAPQ